MALTIVIICLWLMGTIFYFTPKKLSFLKNFVLFMMLVMISRNFMTLVTMEFGYIKTTQEPSMYMYFLIHREVIKPLAVLFFVNVYHQTIEQGQKLMVFLTVFISLITLHYIALQLEVVQYVKWNLAFDVIYEGAYMMIALILSRLLVRIKETQ